MGLKSTTVCLGYQQLTSIDTAASLAVPTGATLAVIAVEAQALRWRDDGTDPTAVVGMPMAVDTVMNYDGDLKRLRLISQIVGAKANVSYYA